MGFRGLGGPKRDRLKLTGSGPPLDGAAVVRAAARFDLGLEPSVPAFYSAVVLLACAGLLWVNGRTERGSRDRWDWWILAIVFVALAIDESVMIHEMANDTLQQLLGTSGVLFFAWIIPGALFTAAVAAFSLRLLRRLDARTRRLFVVAGGVFVGGAIGMEMLAGPIVQAHGAESLEHALEQVVEETMEMTGALIFLYALLDHLGRTVGTVRLSIGAR